MLAMERTVDGVEVSKGTLALVYTGKMDTYVLFGFIVEFLGFLDAVISFSRCDVSRLCG